MIAFAQSDKVYSKYADEIIILLNTGLRILELYQQAENQKGNPAHLLFVHGKCFYYYLYYFSTYIYVEPDHYLKKPASR